jgi:hypothetical protein
MIKDAIANIADRDSSAGMSRVGTAFHRPFEEDMGLSIGASFIIHYLDWQAGNNFVSFAPYSDCPLTGLLPRNAPTGISRP